jgi:hypothetical protein
MPPKFSVHCGDILRVRADVVVLKYAERPFGADAAVAEALGHDIAVEAGGFSFFPTADRIGASEVLVLGVGSLSAFEYSDIESFARAALEIVAAERPKATVVAIALHGPGHGLDELAAIDSLVRGLRQGSEKADTSFSEIRIVEARPARAERLKAFLQAAQLLDSRAAKRSSSKLSPPRLAAAISSSGKYDNRLFAAMPFKDEFLDHWELALQPAAHENELLIERLDHDHFVGDVVAEIRKRIGNCRAVIALLDEGNPNVYLEVGYAWGIERPVILALGEGHSPPFDVQSQRIVRYGRIGELKNRLSLELKALKTQQQI